MGKREPKNKCSALPEYITEEILAWLPLKSLCRFRCVCKEWNALISSTTFIKTNWAEKPPNRNPYLVVQSVDDESNMLDSMAYCFFTQTWQKIPSISLSSFPQEEDDANSLPYPHCFGSSTGLFLLMVGTFPTFVICNPLTRTSVQLPPLSTIADEIGIVGGEGDSRDAYKVVVVVEPSLVNVHIVQVYNSTDKSWRIVGHLPEDVQATGSGPMMTMDMVLCGDSYYCFTLSDEGRGIMAFSVRDGISISAPLPEMAKKDCIYLYLLVCGSRVLVAGGLGGLDDELLREVVIWEFEKQKVDSSSSSSSWWKEIGRMPRSMCQGLNRSFPFDSSMFMRCVGVGDYACFISSSPATENALEVNIVVYSISEKTWSWLPTCPLYSDTADFMIWAGAFEPRPDMMVQ